MKITSDNVLDVLYELRGEDVASFHIGTLEMSLKDLRDICLAAPEMTWSPEAEFRSLSGAFVCTLGNAAYSIRDRDLFGEDTLKFDLSEIDPPTLGGGHHRCEAASVPLQRFDEVGGGNWYFHCKDLKCGKWMHQAQVPGNKVR